LLTIIRKASKAVLLTHRNAPGQRSAVAHDRRDPAPDFVVLADPDGNRFCIVDLSHEQS
jgi:hypothetical protein